MKNVMKTSDLIDRPLDWAVSQIEHPDWTESMGAANAAFVSHYSTDPAQGHPIIERELISTMVVPRASRTHFGPERLWNAAVYSGNTPLNCYGPTPLIAAMRCFVALKLGAEVDVPKELMSPAVAPPAPTEPDHCFSAAQEDVETKGPAP